MSQGDLYGEQPYADDQYAAQSAEAPAAEGSGSKVSVPTILASAGVAAIISALIVTIGVVGLATSDKFGNDTAAAQPTVVNLGSAQGTTTPNGVTGQQNAGDPANGTTAAAPTENVPESDGDAGTGSGTQGTGNGAGTTTEAGTTGDTTQQAATPSPLTAGQLNTKVKIIMNTSASDAARADEMEGGQQALGSVNGVAEMLRVSGAGFSYKIIAPVTQNGKTLNARLQMSLVGNGSRYRDLSWVWVDNKWKLSNESVCVIAEYALLKCTV